ncbi:MAG: endonuclease MutS2 [Clostridium sp.]|nr:endonuclease MutS2 [Clostridium sp.]MCM1547608.1 endonuclease MutS2 [Ruminococcus sp.]
MNKYFKTLELHKILKMLADMASNEKTRKMALELEPSDDYDAVCLEMDKTSQALGLAISFGTPPFYDIKDISSSLRRAASGARISLKELIEVKNLLNQIGALSDWYSHCENVETELDYLFSSLRPNKYLQEKLDRSIISEDEISDAASPELSAIRRKINHAASKLRENLDKMIRSESIQKSLQENIVTMRDGRFVLPVKAEHRSKISGLVHSSSATGQTVFIEPMSVVEANNDIKILEAQEQEEIERIISELCSECGEYAEELIGGYDVCTELNLYFAKANLGAKMKACAPKITCDGKLKLNKARHPLLDMKRAVPIDISLGESCSALIITGPNTGGKTVALKTAGLLAAMVMCGMLIPVSDGSIVSVYKNILADIGDDQSIEQSLSTFSSHTNKIIEIIDLANENSLVLLDEPGSGTDPVEGAALASAIIERLKDQGAKLMVSTHYQELKLYAIETDDVENASCEFDPETLRPTFRLITGSPGKSNAFSISASLGMPQDVIEHAKRLVSDENARFEKVVEQLEESRRRLEAQNDELGRLKAEAEENSRKLKAQLDEIEKNKENQLEQARLKATSIIESVKAESNILMDELENLKKEKDKKDFAKKYSDIKTKSKQSFNKMYDTANPLEKRSDDGYRLPRKLKKGDTVLVKDIDKKGTLCSDPDDSGNVFVQIGIMKTKVSILQLRLVEEQKVTYKSKPVSTRNIKSKLERKGTMELDIRGKSADEGVYEMEAFIDSAMLSGLSTVTIIHGKGTGILRAAIHQRLKSMKQVKSYRLGLYGEGENGVTIVELK